MVQDIVVAINKNVDFGRRLKLHVPENFTVLEKQNIRMLPTEVRMKPVSCVILYIEHVISDELHFERFKESFPHIPCIAVLVHPNIEIARYCGVKGIDGVLPVDEIDLIGDEIDRVRGLKNNKVFLANISINKMNEDYSEIVKEALSIIEHDYVKLLNTNEVADLLEIAEATLSREFVKFGLPGPKKILTRMKIEHAVKLMQNKGLNIREIASLSGFTEEKRMAECFHRMFNMPPGEYRAKYIGNKFVRNK